MSLIPEKPLIISPSLAATLGLEEAVLLHVLGEIRMHTSVNPANGCETSLDQLQQFLPFWDAAAIQRIATNLRDMGVLQIHSAPIDESHQLVFAIDSSPQTTQPASVTQPSAPSFSGTETPSTQRSEQSSSVLKSRQNPTAPPAIKKSANLISQRWQPCTDTFRQLAQYNIPRPFIEQQIPEFVTYWAERGEPQYSWGSKFIKRVLHAWRSKQQDIAKQGQQTLMHDNWRPSDDALQILTRQAGISLNFCEDAIPEFVLYWQERGEPSSTWNSRFISHVRRQWARYTATMENDAEPRPLPANWQPSASLFEVLALANIPQTFAQQQIAEFVLYWQESGQIFGSWNTKFLQQVKRQWAKHRHLQQDNQHERQQNAGQSISTRNRSLEEDLTDRSWAQ